MRFLVIFLLVFFLKIIRGDKIPYCEKIRQHEFRNTLFPIFLLSTQIFSFSNISNLKYRMNETFVSFWMTRYIFRLHYVSFIHLTLFRNRKPLHHIDRPRGIDCQRENFTIYYPIVSRCFNGRFIFTISSKVLLLKPSSIY